MTQYEIMKQQEKHQERIRNLKLLAAAFLVLVIANIAKAEYDPNCSNIFNKCDVVIEKSKKVIDDLKDENKTQAAIIDEQEKVIKNKDVQLNEISEKKDKEKEGE